MKHGNIPALIVAEFVVIRRLGVIVVPEKKLGRGVALGLIIVLIAVVRAPPAVNVVKAVPRKRDGEREISGPFFLNSKGRTILLGKVGVVSCMVILPFTNPAIKELRQTMSLNTSLFGSKLMANHSLKDG